MKRCIHLLNGIVEVIEVYLCAVVNSTEMSREGKVYVGNLPPDVKQRDIEDLFYKFGKINNINLKTTTQQPFAFLEFEDPRYVCLMLLLKCYY